jgi:hypothetical protein
LPAAVTCSLFAGGSLVALSADATDPTLLRATVPAKDDTGTLLTWSASMKPEAGSTTTFQVDLSNDHGAGARSLFSVDEIRPELLGILFYENHTIEDQVDVECKATATIVVPPPPAAPISCDLIVGGGSTRATLTLDANDLSAKTVSASAPNDDGTVVDWSLSLDRFDVAWGLTSSPKEVFVYANHSQTDRVSVECKTPQP